MNKKIKTRKDIEKEIDDLLINFKTGKLLAHRINQFLDNISGKEIITRWEIKAIIFNKILSVIKDPEKNFIVHKDLIRIFPILGIINKDIDGFRADANKKSDENNKEDVQFEFPSSYKIPFHIMNMHKERYTFVDTVMLSLGYLENLFSINGRINDLFLFLNNNKDLSDLLQEYIYFSQKELIKNMVLQKIAPLNLIFIFFDLDKSVKENTNELYLLLNKEFPKTTIQTAIHANLDKIRKGTFSVPGS